MKVKNLFNERIRGKNVTYLFESLALKTEHIIGSDSNICTDKDIICNNNQIEKYDIYKK